MRTTAELRRRLALLRFVEASDVASATTALLRDLIEEVLWLRGERENGGRAMDELLIRLNRLDRLGVRWEASVDHETVETGTMGRSYLKPTGRSFLTVRTRHGDTEIIRRRIDLADGPAQIDALVAVWEGLPWRI